MARVVNCGCPTCRMRIGATWESRWESIRAAMEPQFSELPEELAGLLRAAFYAGIKESQRVMSRMVREDCTPLARSMWSRQLENELVGFLADELDKLDLADREDELLGP